MAVASKNKTSRTAKTSTTTRRIRGTGSRKTAVPMARQKDIPAGQYRSKIAKISPKKTMSGEEAIEIIYELTAPDGNVKKMREVIPCDSWAYERFCDALIAAGLKDDDDITDAVGVTEDVYLTYPDARGLGHFSKRTPVITNGSPGTPADDDDEADLAFDLLADEEAIDEDGYLDFELD